MQIEKVDPDKRVEGFVRKFDVPDWRDTELNLYLTLTRATDLSTLPMSTLTPIPFPRTGKFQSLLVSSPWLSRFLTRHRRQDSTTILNRCNPWCGMCCGATGTIPFTPRQHMPVTTRRPWRVFTCDVLLFSGQRSEFLTLPPCFLGAMGNVIHH